MNVKLYNTDIDRTGENIMTPTAHRTYLDTLTGDYVHTVDVPAVSLSVRFTITLPFGTSGVAWPVQPNYMEIDGSFYFLTPTDDTPVVGVSRRYVADLDKAHTYGFGDPAVVFTKQSIMTRSHAAITATGFPGYAEYPVIEHGAKYITRADETDTTWRVVIIYDHTLKRSWPLDSTYVADHCTGIGVSDTAFASYGAAVTSVLLDLDVSTIQWMKMGFAMAIVGIYIIKTAYIPEVFLDAHVVTIEGYGAQSGYKYKIHDIVPSSLAMGPISGTVSVALPAYAASSDVFIGNSSVKIPYPKIAKDEYSISTIMTVDFLGKDMFHFLLKVGDRITDWTQFVTYSFTTKLYKIDSVALTNEAYRNAISLAGAGIAVAGAAATIASGGAALPAVGTIIGAAGVGGSVAINARRDKRQTEIVSQVGSSTVSSYEVDTVYGSLLEDNIFVYETSEELGQPIDYQLYGYETATVYPAPISTLLRSDRGNRDETDRRYNYTYVRGDLTPNVNAASGALKNHIALHIDDFKAAYQRGVRIYVAHSEYGDNVRSLYD